MSGRCLFCPNINVRATLVFRFHRGMVVERRDSMSKVSIIGAGFVGSTVAHWAMISGGCQITLLDVVDGLAKG
jgi:threonine dehydrogenase-like Zn-dependent dehydrogenase